MLKYLIKLQELLSLVMILCWLYQHKRPTDFYWIQCLQSSENLNIIMDVVLYFCQHYTQFLPLNPTQWTFVQYFLINTIICFNFSNCSRQFDVCDFSFSKTDGVNHLFSLRSPCCRAESCSAGRGLRWADLLRSTVSNTSTHPRDRTESSSRLHDPCLIFRKYKPQELNSFSF